MKNDILEIITQYKYDHISSEQAVFELLDLFGVVGQSEQLVCDHQWKSRFSEKRGSWRLCAKCSKEE